MTEDNNQSSSNRKQYSSKVEEAIRSSKKAQEMEEFYLKVQVDLENALTQGGDYLHILEDVYSHSDKAEEIENEKFKQFGLLKSQKIDQIYMINCFKDSGKHLFDICLSDKILCQSSVSFILNAIKNYVRYKLGELIEQLSLESQTIHFFVMKDQYIVSVVTSKPVPRDRIWNLAIQIVTIVKKHDEETLRENPEFLKEINEIIESTQASLVRKSHTLKVILVGDGAVGKTSIRRQYLGEGFRNDYQMTIGADLAKKESPVLYSGGRQIKYIIWDLAGQQRFEKVRTAYYTSAMGALAVFDTTRIESFQNIVAWMNEFWKNNGQGPVPLIILGNKVDLRGEVSTSVSDAKAQRFANMLSQVAEKHRGFKIYYLPTSAKTGLNIDLAFELLGESIIDFFESSKGPE
ncbi:MAG: Rab family GTPase [Candidatus Hodarchaeales archaeon]|jgi:small GTP-binding protein